MMHMVWQRYVNGIDFRIRQQRLIIIIDMRDFISSNNLPGIGRRSRRQGVNPPVTGFLNGRNNALARNRGVAQDAPVNLIRH